MSWFVKSLLILAVCIGATWLIRGYGEYMKKRRIESRELIMLIGLVRRNLSARLLTPKESLAGASGFSAGIERVCILVAEGKALPEAFALASPHLSLSGECKRLTGEHLALFGAGRREDEVRCLDELLERLSALVDKEEASGENDLRVARSVIIAIALGIIIFII